MSTRPWHKRFHEDALNGYMGLTLEERGAYTTLLDLLYHYGEAILDNERLIAGWMQCSVRKYRAMRDRLIELGKIIRLDDGRLTNPRFEREAENARVEARKNAESGSIGGRKSGEVRKNANKNSGYSKRTLQKNEAISEAQSLRTSSDTSEIDPIVVGADAPSSAGRKYAFEAGIIRLSEHHLEMWRKAFPHISLEAELWALSPWASGKGGDWFFAVSQALAKKEREARERINIARMAAERGRPALRVSGDGRI